MANAPFAWPEPTWPHTTTPDTTGWKHVPTGPRGRHGQFTPDIARRERNGERYGPKPRRRMVESSARIRKAKRYRCRIQCSWTARERQGDPMAQRNSMNITNAVSSDVSAYLRSMGGEFLKYLPGVDLDIVEADTRPGLGGPDPSIPRDEQWHGDGQARKLSSRPTGQTMSGGRRKSVFGFEQFPSTASSRLDHLTTAVSRRQSHRGSDRPRTKKGFDRKERTFGLQYCGSANPKTDVCKRPTGRRHPRTTRSGRARRGTTTTPFCRIALDCGQRQRVKHV